MNDSARLPMFFGNQMIVLRCSRCDKDLEVLEPLSNQTIVCSSCGQLLAKGSAAATAVKRDADETVGPIEPMAAAEIEADDFPFFTPPRGGNEIGWLRRYRVLKLLGKGGMALVFEAEDTSLLRQVALKVMKPEVARDSLAPQRFLREARVMASLHNDHIVTIFDVDQEGTFPFLAMELLRGEPLDVWLKQNRPVPAEVIDLGLQLARGLTAAHQSGLIHRDIKPSNIWVEEPGRRIKILDFGLARSTQETGNLTFTGAVVGSPAAMAPAQAAGTPVDERCDLFSLGCVLYELSTGVQAFTGTSAIAILKAVALTEPKSMREVNPAMPPALNELVKRLLAKDPNDRPPSAAAVVDSLLAIAGGKGPTSSVRIAPGAGKPAPTSSRRVKHGWLAAGLGAVVVLLIWAFVFGPLGPFFQKRGKNALDSQGAALGGAPDIVMGMSAPFSGPARELGREMDVGIRTYFEHVNDQGGIAGRKLHLVALDDGYEPVRARANMQELFEKHKVFGVIGNVGTATSEKALPYALEKHLLFFGAFTGAPILRKDPPDRYVFNFRASYEEETAAIFKFLVDLKKVRPEQIAVFAQQDGYGDAGVRGVIKMLRKYGRDSDKLLRVGHARNTVDVDAAVQKIEQTPDVRAVIMVSTYRPAARFIQKVKYGTKARERGKEIVFANVSFVGSDPLADEFAQLGPSYGEGVIVTQVVPHIDSQASAVLKYRDLLTKYHPNEKPSFVSLEGYIDAMLLTESLRRAGDNLTTASLIQALESVRNLDLGIGTPLSFGPSEHQASHKVWGTMLDKSGHYQILELD